MNKITIGVTDCSKYDNYARWIQAYGSEVEVLKLSEKVNNFQAIARCQGVLFSGGEDVHPRFYSKPEYLSYCHLDDVNEERDNFEFKLLEYTERNQIPVLGICRGLQVYNVFMGGTLIPDIPAWGKPQHSKLNDGADRYHAIKVIPGSWFAELIGQIDGEVNSNHHQSIDSVGNGLIISATSNDGIIEAVDRIDLQGKGFLCMVQWHPERMDNQQSSFVYKLRGAFIKAAKQLNNF